MKFEEFPFFIRIGPQLGYSLWYYTHKSKANLLDNLQCST